MLNGNTAALTRSLEDCEEVLEAELPIVVSVMADINEPRIPSVTQILKAGRKPREILELEVTGTNQLETINNLAPNTERKQIEVKTVEELVRAIEAEGLI
jgi:electron transfer flavoprotein beta subunit